MQRSCIEIFIIVKKVLTWEVAPVHNEMCTKYAEKNNQGGTMAAKKKTTKKKTTKKATKKTARKKK